MGKTISKEALDDIKRFAAQEGFTFDTLSNFERNIDWRKISYQDYSFDFLKKFSNKIIWGAVNYSNYTDDQLREVRRMISWDKCSQCLAERSIEFLDEFADKVYWYWVSRYWVLSEECIKKYFSRLSLGMILRHQKMSEALVEELVHPIDYWIYASYQPVSDEFCNKYFNDLKSTEVHVGDKTIREFFNHKDYQELSLDYSFYSKVLERECLIIEISGDKKEIWVEVLYEEEANNDYDYDDDPDN